MNETIPSYFFCIAGAIGFLLGWIIGRGHMASILIKFLEGCNDELGTDETDDTVRKLLFGVREHLKKVAYLRRLF